MSDYIDTRDLMEEYDECQRLYLPEEVPEDERDRMKAIADLMDEIGEQTMRDGDASPLVPRHDWIEYTQELAEDIGAVQTDNGWPNYCIDWEYAARELAMDYGIVEFEGTDYYYRSV